MVEITLGKVMEKLEILQSEISSIKNILSTENFKIPNTPVSQETIRKESFMEFFNKFNPKNDMDKTIAIMRFLELNRDIQNITTKDIAGGFNEVREKKPKNIADKIQLLHKKGVIMPGEIVDNLKGWRITRSGLDYLEEMKNGN